MPPCDDLIWYCDVHDLYYTECCTHCDLERIARIEALPPAERREMRRRQMQAQGIDPDLMVRMKKSIPGAIAQVIQIEERRAQREREKK